MKILVVNAGSSSLKYQLFDMESGDILAKGICERIAIDGKITHKLPDGRKIEMDLDMPNHAVATKILVDTLTNAEYGCIKDMSEIEAVGPRCPRRSLLLRIQPRYPRGYGKAAPVR